jgi:hypothetical protein
MTGWEQEMLDYINTMYFRVTDAGPLHAPVQSLSIRRNEKLQLILQTKAPSNAKSTAIEYMTMSKRSQARSCPSG